MNGIAETLEEGFEGGNELKPPLHTEAGLTFKQYTFAHEYVRDHNGRAAATRAGYTKRYADQLAYRMLRIPRVAALVRELDAEHNAKLHAKVVTTPENVLTEITYLSESDLRDIFDEEGNTRPPHELPTRVARAIKSIEVVPKAVTGEGGEKQTVNVYKYSFWDKPAALNMLARYHGILADRPPDETLASMEIETKRELRRQILRELSGLATPTGPPVLNQDGTEA